MIAELDRLRERYGALLVWLLWAHVPLMGLAALWNKALSVPAAMASALNAPTSGQMLGLTR